MIINLEFIHLKQLKYSFRMGNICEVDNDCLQPPIREHIRQRSASEKNENLSIKKMIQFKKMKITQEYEIDGLLGEGSYGSVFRVKHRQTKVLRAAKRIEKQKRTIQSLDQFLILKRLDHPNIIRLYDIYSESKYLFIVMDYCEGGQLFDRVVKQGSLTQNQARLYLKQILSGIQHCHANGIMHRDLKPQNVMFLDQKEKDLKIIDFGVGASFKEDSKSTLKVGSVLLLIGQIYYIAPEVILKKYDQKCDIWSIGIILYILLTGAPPFGGKNDKEIYRQILKADVPYPLEKWSKISKSAKSLVQKMLVADPAKRISAKQALSDPWIREVPEEGQKPLEVYNFKSLKRFCEMNQFQTAIMAYIAHNFIDSQLISELQSKFKAIDHNGDGRISWKQFNDCISYSMQPITEQKIREMFDAIDKNHSGFIDYSEFIASSIDKSYLRTEKVVEKAFQLIDKDHNGYLSREELMAAFGGCNSQIEDYIMNEFDINRDGSISKYEFKVAMKGMLKK